MILQTDKKLNMLHNSGLIPHDSRCFGKRKDGKTGWCTPGGLVGTRWNKHSVNSPSIILVK